MSREAKENVKVTFSRMVSMREEHTASRGAQNPSGRRASARPEEPARAAPKPIEGSTMHDRGRRGGRRVTDNASVAHRRSSFAPLPGPSRARAHCSPARAREVDGETGGAGGGGGSTPPLPSLEVPLSVPAARTTERGLAAYKEPPATSPRALARPRPARAGGRALRAAAARALAPSRPRPAAAARARRACALLLHELREPLRPGGLDADRAAAEPAAVERQPRSVARRARRRTWRVAQSRRDSGR